MVSSSNVMRDFLEGDERGNHRSQILCQEVCWVLFPINEEDFHELSLNNFMNIVVADVDMFRPFFGHRVTGNEDQALVIP